MDEYKSDSYEEKDILKELDGGNRWYGSWTGYAGACFKQ